ncbi:MAG: crossover junction endodeoxyribonuclease RuvC [Candidatus Paceibacterota bacterium]|jgi:crossover junction endodeoxyribonuclease RuvC
MKILGIDPGYDRLGLAVIEKPLKGKEIVLFSTCLQTSKDSDIYTRFGQIGTEVSRILDEYKPDSMALENLFITKNQKTAMRVAEARGIIIYEAVKRNIPVFEYSPMQVKTSITGDGGSNKDRIFKMLNLLVKIPKRKALDDEYDAIAVALTHSAHSRS